MTSAHIKNILPLVALLASLPVWSQGDKAVYRCPGNPPLYTDALSAKEAKEKGCRTLEGAPITVIQSPKSRGTPVPSVTRSEGPKVDASEQRARDTDARRILESELKKEEDQLAALKKEYNNGEPEKMGPEHRNHQKYLDRVAEMKAAITRKEGDVAALRRELGNLPSGAAKQLQ